MGRDNRPERTCVACRHRAPKRELIRVVLADGRLVVDTAARLPGRGAYVHRDPECTRLATRTGALARALRASISPEELSNLLEATKGVMTA